MYSVKRPYISAILISIGLAFFAYDKFILPANNGLLTREPLSITSGDTKHDFMVQVARSEDEQEQGLMFVQHLDEDKGMLFPQNPDTDMHMWMKNTLIPLDMLFIDSKGKIVYIARNTVSQSEKTISAGIPVRAVLELAGGVTLKDHIDIGDTVTHSSFEP